MEKNKQKTKSELLNELESIQGLLKDDEIPLLHEVIDKLEPENPSSGMDQPLSSQFSDEDLQLLQGAYDALLDRVDERARDELPLDEENLELDLGQQEPPRPTFDHSTDTDTAPTNSDSSAVTAPTDNGVLPGQQALFQPAANPSLDGPETSDFTAKDTGKVGASGENPFLPQHIRERLRGNRGYELPAHDNDPSREYTRGQLVDDLVDSVMPQLEKTLRLKLAAMSEEQLKQLLK